MSKLKTDKNGYPDIYIGEKVLINFTDIDAIPYNEDISVVEPESVGKYKYIPWYSDNTFPETAIQIIDKTPVLKRALINKSKITVAQGIYPTRLIEFSENGNEKLEVVNDPEIVKLMQKYIIRRYLGNSAYDLYSFGNAFVKLIPNVTGDKILKILPIDAKHCRLGNPDKKTGKINELLISPSWEDAEEKTITSLILLDETDPMKHLKELKESNLLKAPIAMQLKGDFSSNDFYSMPPWYSAKQWIDIAEKVAKLSDASMNNMLNIFIHLQIPYSYWEKKYPLDEFEGKRVERNKKIQADIALLEEKLTGAENAKKTLITYFGDPEADGNDEWKLQVIDNKISNENLVTSTAADTQIAIAAGIMPDLLGLMYGNSKGGSMQRELLLIQYALSWLDRQMLADPLELMLKFNLGDSYSDIELRFRNTFLTTLDSGKETGTNIS